MIIREANIRNLEDVAKLNFELDKFERNWYPYIIPKIKNSKKWIKGKFSGNKVKIFIAIENKKIVGFVFGWIYKREYHNKIKRCGYCCDLFVEGKYRNKGIGWKLMEKFEKWCKKKGLEYVELSTNIKNTNAQEFYFSRGFREFEKLYVKKL